MRTLSRKKTLVLFAAAFGVTLLVTAPASLLGAWINSSTHGALVLSNPEGTIWRGSAVPVFQPPHGDPVALEKINWKVSLLSLFRGKIGLAMSQGTQPSEPMEMEAGLQGVELRHLSLEIPAGLLEEIHPLLQALRPQGKLQITGEHLTFSGLSMQGTASAKWLGASAAFSSVNPFGSYQISLNGTGAHVAVELTTVSGPLMLSGKGEWSAASGLTLEAHANTNTENREALAELLHHLGPEISPGTHLIKIGRAI